MGEGMGHIREILSFPLPAYSVSPDSTSVFSFFFSLQTYISFFFPMTSLSVFKFFLIFLFIHNLPSPIYYSYHSAHLFSYLSLSFSSLADVTFIAILPHHPEDKTLVPFFSSIERGKTNHCNHTLSPLQHTFIGRHRLHFHPICLSLA